MTVKKRLGADEVPRADKASSRWFPDAKCIVAEEPIRIFAVVSASPDLQNQLFVRRRIGYLPPCGPQALPNRITPIQPNIPDQPSLPIQRDGLTRRLLAWTCTRKSKAES